MLTSHTNTTASKKLPSEFPILEENTDTHEVSVSLSSEDKVSPDASPLPNPVAESSFQPTQRLNSSSQHGTTMPLTTSNKVNLQPSKATKSTSIVQAKIDCGPCMPLQEWSAVDHRLGLSSPCHTDVTDTASSTFHHRPNFNGNHPALQPFQEENTDTNVTNDLEKPHGVELARLRRELEVAQNRIALMDQELTQTRITEHTLQQVLGSPSGSDKTPHLIADQIPEKWEGSQSSQSLAGGIALPDQPNPETRGLFSNVQADWSDHYKTSILPSSSRPPSRLHPAWNHQFPAFWAKSDPEFDAITSRLPPSQFVSSNRFDPFATNRPMNQSRGDISTEQALRRVPFQGDRSGTALGMNTREWVSYPASSMSTPGISPPMTPMPFPSSGYIHAPVPYQPRPIGTPLSPTAMEFNAATLPAHGDLTGGVWNNHPVSEHASTSSAYMNHVEPINYRRLLDKNMSCNWKYIVDKIVCSNDQQASIFLQQKLKVATPEQKFELVEAIIAQAYPLMINRFGNFLVQRCFEHGTPEQVIAIANAIRGNTLNLSMDAFGCHVVQKAFDAVPEEYKAIMVHELLRRIPETVIHRYACHVWQKLFELRWSDSPPQIMKYVNEALRGMWHEVALGETGSLVVQNIFENCLEEDKRPCISEVLASIDIVSHGQFGNWCIQHVCEHGAPQDKTRAIEHVLRFATEYSTDQFASKVVEKCLKVGGSDFLDRYLKRVCEGRPDRPRMPLIDIAGDQYGNYLVQYILINAESQHRELVAQHVRKHMVSLRGSKFGSRVAMLCSNPAFSTRPGPPSAMPVHTRYYHTGNSMASGGPARPAMPGTFR